MPKTMRISVSIEDENGEILVSNTSERSVPYIDEFKEQGFRAAFNDLETAVLESRKEISDQTVSKYLEEISQKKPYLKQEAETFLKKRNTE